MPLFADGRCRSRHCDQAADEIAADPCIPSVGAAGFEPATSCSQSTRANQAALRPVGARVPFPVRHHPGYAASMGDGVGRTGVGYYVALALLGSAVAIGAGLFVLLTTRTAPEDAMFEVGRGRPVTCPTGTHAPACYAFAVTNTGNSDGVALCTAISSGGTTAVFPNGETIVRVALASGLPQDVVVGVTPTEGDTVIAPSLGCQAA
jgi:hypothetical protein